MTAPERFAEKSDSLLHRGRRPYMTHNVTSPPPNDAVRKSIRSPRAGLRAARPKRRLPKSTPDFTIPCQIYPNADESCSPFGLRPALERLCHEFWPLLRGENSNTKGRG